MYVLSGSQGHFRQFWSFCVSRGIWVNREKLGERNCRSREKRGDVADAQIRSTDRPCWTFHAAADADSPHNGRFFFPEMRSGDREMKV
jgi:hypothetical protein